MALKSVLNVPLPSGYHITRDIISQTVISAGTVRVVSIIPKMAENASSRLYIIYIKIILHVDGTFVLIHILFTLEFLLSGISRVTFENVPSTTHPTPTPDNDAHVVIICLYGKYILVCCI